MYGYRTKVSGDNSFSKRERLIDGYGLIGGGLEGLRVASPKDLLSFSHVQKATRTDRVRMGALRNLSSRPEGLRATVEEQLARWEEENKLKDDPEKKAGVGAHTKLGIGLPMSNIFAT